MVDKSSYLISQIVLKSMSSDLIFFKTRFPLQIYCLVILEIYQTVFILHFRIAFKNAIQVDWALHVQYFFKYILIFSNSADL